MKLLQRKRSRIRRWFKWVGSVLSSVILIWAVMSYWYGIGWGDFKILGSSRVEYWTQNGVFVYQLYTNYRPNHGILEGWRVWRISKKYYVWRFGYSQNAWGYKIRIPLWLPFLLFALPSAYLWWMGWWNNKYYPPQPDHCQKCGYNLTGNTSGTCPECGTSHKGHGLHQ